MTRTIENIMEHLLAHSKVEGECLVWKRSLGTNGYGAIKIGGKQLSVHRVAWVERHGPIPPETPYVLHRCDNPPCWRDDHLFLGTQAQNNEDKASKGRSRNQNSDKEACDHGHPFDETNTRIRPSGGRECKTCAREQLRKRREKKEVADSRLMCHSVLLPRAV